MTRVSLRLADVSDPLNKIVAEKIIELAQAGERDPNGLCERTLSFFRVQRLGPNKGGVWACQDHGQAAANGGAEMTRANEEMTEHILRGGKLS